MSGIAEFYCRFPRTRIVGVGRFDEIWSADGEATQCHQYAPFRHGFPHYKTHRNNTKSLTADTTRRPCMPDSMSFSRRTPQRHSVEVAPRTPLALRTPSHGRICLPS
jgi:hypothetical protein